MSTTHNTAVGPATAVCTIDGCSKPLLSRGLCGAHYRSEKRAGRLQKLDRPKTCLVEDCENDVHSKGLCTGHGLRLKKNGDVDAQRPLRQSGLEDRAVRRWGFDDNYAPTAETNTLLLDVDAVLEEYRDYLPLTVRQVYYRLVATNTLDKGDKAYKRLAGHLANARRGRRIPFESIRDEETVSKPYVFADLEEFEDELRTSIDSYRRDPQSEEPRYIELWCEAAGMVPQLAKIARRYGVPVYSTGGMGSITNIHTLAERVVGREDPTVLLHLGDFDSNGVALWEAIANDGAAFVEDMFGPGWFEPIRLGLTEEQVDKHKLTTETETGQHTAGKAWREVRDWRCQLEALPPDLINSMVEEALAGYFDADQMSRLQETGGRRA
jgi:hypothetical protein